MKKLLVSLLVICLMMISMASVFGATVPSDADFKTPPTIVNLKIDHNSEHVWLEVDLKTPNNVQNAIEYSQEDDNWEEVGYISAIEMKVTIDGKEYEDYLDMNYSEEKNAEPMDNLLQGVFETVGLSELTVNSEIRAQVRYRGTYGLSSPDIRYSDWSKEVVLNEKTNFQASQWAQSELASATELGLIPDGLKDKDLTKSITREEFAEVSVKAYEALTGIKATPVTTNPFTDTKNTEVLKAYNLGITTGTSATTFDPNASLNREQAATMLTRTYKKATIDGWTIQTDSNFPLE